MLFDLSGKVAIVTGGAGLLGQEHCAAIREAGGIAIALDVVDPIPPYQWFVNIMDYSFITHALRQTIDYYGRVDILINNAAINSEQGEGVTFENYTLEAWKKEIDVGLTGAFLCCQIIGGWMAEHGGGVIVNIGSDFTNIAPNPAHYAPNVKPPSYSVVKHGIHGLTKYLAAYWAGQGVRVNTLSPGGVLNGQDAEFVARISSAIPLGHMADKSAYRGAIQFLCSDASAYMTGHNLIMDGGRSII